MIKDLRVWLFKQNQKQIRYKHSIYEFHGNILNAKSLGTHEICNTEQHTDIVTNPEWIDMNVANIYFFVHVRTKLDHFFLSFWQNILDAGKSGIILIKLTNSCVGVVQSTSTIIISFKIELPNKYVLDVSTHIGRIEHIDRILQENDAQLKFDATNCNQLSIVFF